MKTSLSKLAFESLKENIAIAELCLKTSKQEGGCYGVPATILLFSALDAIGSFYCLDPNAKSIKRNNFVFTFSLYCIVKNQKFEHYVGETISHFDAIWTKYSALIKSYGIKDKATWLEIYKQFRCAFTHNATISPYMYINADNTNCSNNVFIKDNGISILYLNPFFQMVNTIFMTFKSNYEYKILDNNNLDLFFNESSLVTGSTTCNIQIFK